MIYFGREQFNFPLDFQDGFAYSYVYEQLEYSSSDALEENT